MLVNYIFHHELHNRVMGEDRLRKGYVTKGLTTLSSRSRARILGVRARHPTLTGTSHVRNDEFYALQGETNYLRSLSVRCLPGGDPMICITQTFRMIRFELVFSESFGSE